MHLITPLAAGVVGCESGTFSIVRRGTSTPASYYTDFEGLTSPITGTNIALDSRGGGVFYVNELVKVTCKNAAGSTIREFVAGDEATCLDVRSDSFKGTHYQTAAIAAGNPITLKALFDKWNDSAGAVDWKVMIDGVETDLEDAFSALQGQRRFVVTAYGAVGDGVTNDLSAVNAALSAANAAGGGVVVFPPGTYALSGTISAYSTVALEGAGVGITTIKMTTNNLFLNAGANFPLGVSGFSFTYSTGSFNGWLQISSGAPAGVIEDCDFQAVTSSAIAGIGVTCSSTRRFYRCTFRKDSSTGIFFNVGNNSADTDVVLSECSFVVTGTLAGYFVYMDGLTAASKISIYNSVFDASSVNSGSGALIGGNDGLFMVHGSRILPPGVGVTSWVVFDMFGELVESGNSLQSTVDNVSASYMAYRLNDADSRKSKLYSRELLVAAALNPNTATITIHPDQAGAARVTTTTGTGGTQAITPGTSQCADGARCVVSVHNDTAGSITYQWSGVIASTATFAVAANTIRSFLLAFNLARGKWYLVSDVAGAELAE